MHDGVLKIIIIFWVIGLMKYFQKQSDKRLFGPQNRKTNCCSNLAENISVDFKCS